MAPMREEETLMAAGLCADLEVEQLPWSALVARQRSNPARRFAGALAVSLALGAATFWKCRGGGPALTKAHATVELFPTGATPVDCQLSARDSKKLLLLSSSALTAVNLKQAFREMVLQLPDVAWETDGARKKRWARNADLTVAAGNGFKDPTLYDGLKVLIIDDAGFLEDSYWNNNNTNFSQAKGINYKKLGSNTSATLVKLATDGFKGLDGGWSCDYASPDCGGLGSLGFDADAFTHVSIFDLCATDVQKASAFLAQSGKGGSSALSDLASASLDPHGQCSDKLRGLLYGADVLAVNGGNPDWLAFEYHKLAPFFSAMIIDRLENGSLIYLGRSAGSMVAGSDFGLAFEPNPVFLGLLGNETRGLQLAGTCAIRPHYTPKWDLASNVYEKASHGRVHIVLVPDGEGLACISGRCAMVGSTSREGASIFGKDGSAHLHIDRLVDALEWASRNASSGFKPHHAKRISPNCSMDPSRDGKSLVMLTSNALANPPLKLVFRKMVLELPDSAWPRDGAAIKALAKARPEAIVEAADFMEPALYKGLKVMIIEDAAFLKASMWDDNNSNFSVSSGVNYRKCYFRTPATLVKDATEGFQGMDTGWSCDYAAAEATCGGMGSLGFTPQDFTHVSIFDMCASNEEKAAAFKLQSRGKVPAARLNPVTSESSCGGKFLDMLEDQDIIAVQGGNPDWLKFVFMEFAPSLLSKVVQRVRDGSLIYLGRNAGAMIAGADIGMTYKPNPIILESLLNNDTKGLNLAGVCAICPDYGDNGLWDYLSSLYEDMTIGSLDVVRVPNNEALCCMKGACHIYGLKAAEGMASLERDSAGIDAARLEDAIRGELYGRPHTL